MAFRTSARLILAILVAETYCVAAHAQTPSQDPPANSVAEAAKLARERKKDAASAKKVITDDDLNTADMKPGDEGLKVSTPQLETEPPSPAVVAADEAADKKAETSPPDDPLKKTDSAKVAKLKVELAQAEEDLKLSQRESQLEQDTVFSNPDYQHDTAGKAKLEELQQQINDKQSVVEQLKARLSELEQALSQQGGAPPASQTPATPPQP
jgi:predicted RNase H-like nuclease (RuvC/YqgF family)